LEKTIKAKNSSMSSERETKFESAKSPRDECRRFDRFPFSAMVVATDLGSGTQLSGKTLDMGMGGCYVESLDPFPIGTALKILLTKEETEFEALASVVSSKVGMGMGVEFISAAPVQFRIFRGWLDELMGKSPREQNKQERFAENAEREVRDLRQDSTLMELLIVLMGKGVLSDSEGKALIEELYQ
jgi:hypothetical protein